MTSLSNSGAVLRECLEAGRVVICPVAARNGSVAETRAMLAEFGYDLAGRRHVERVPGLPEATVAFAPCVDIDAPIDPRMVALVGLADFRMLAVQASDAYYRDVR